jgi:hypothetical protein
LSNHFHGLCHTFPRFAHNPLFTSCRIHCEIASGQIHDSKQRDISNQQIHPIAWNGVYWLPRYASTVVCHCIMLQQLLYRWQH